MDGPGRASTCQPVALQWQCGCVSSKHMVDASCPNGGRQATAGASQGGGGGCLLCSLRRRRHLSKHKNFYIDVINMCYR